MRRRYVTTDVFTDRQFGGNPLAVVLDAAGLDGARMQAIAREFNYSETTFVLPPRDPAHTAHVRIFTPTFEMPFAGHPNVGTAYVLAQHHRHLDRMVFEEIAGLVPIDLIRDGDAIVGATITAPNPLSRTGGADPARVAACCGLSPADILSTRHAPEIVTVGAPFVVAEIASRDALRRACPDVAEFRATFPLAGADAIYLYTRDVSLADGCDTQARMFAPLDGIIEDPATGSATAACCALLAALAGTDLALDVIQGTDMGRPSQLRARATHRAGAIHASIGGRCVPVMEGTLRLASDD